jgi:hypothetical protein
MMTLSSRDTLASLMGIIYLSKAAHPEEFPDANSERRRSLIDIIEPRLKAEAAQLGLPYLRPTLTRDGEELLSFLPKRFVLKYGRELSFTHRAGMSLVCI